MDKKYDASLFVTFFCYNIVFHKVELTVTRLTLWRVYVAEKRR